MTKRELDWNRIILAFLIANLLFFIGIGIGYFVREIMEKTTITFQQQISNEYVSLETLSMLEKDFPCSSFSLDKSSEKLDYIGSLIDSLEIKKGVNDKGVLEIKKFYTILEARHYVLIKERNLKCNENFSTIIYLYSNKKECKLEVDKISFILSYLIKQYPNLKVYSFDLNLDSEIINFFKSKYKIKNECYSVILNDKIIKNNIQNADDLINFLKN